MKKQRDHFTNRSLAFAEDPPDGWWPSFEDEVYLPHRPPFLLAPRGVITRTFAMDVFEISYSYGGQFRKTQLELSELRPTGFKIEWQPSGRAIFVRKNGRPTGLKREWIYSEKVARCHG
jgi:hypothetical protein